MMLILLPGAPTPMAAQTGKPLAAELGSMLEGAGLSPVDPPAAAIDFELPSLAGGRARLSDFAERWVVLTFVATWCKPCLIELPTLEQLAVEVAELPVAVVGVSIDDELADLDGFREGLGISFPLLWDEAGDVGRFYRAHSIPLTYVIDPGGRIVAASRGARDWSKMLPLFQALSGDVGADSSAYSSAQSPIELPMKLEPPDATVSLSSLQVQLGETFDLAVRVTWSGHFQEYVLMPPDVELPEGIERVGISAQTSTVSGASVVDYRVALRAVEIGRFALNPVGLRYTPRGESEVVARRISGPTVEVVGAGPASLSLLIATVLALTLLATAALWWRRRPAAAVASDDPWSEIGELRQQLQRHRLEGDGSAALATMQQLLALVSPAPAQTDLAAELDGWSERARFANEAPERIELDRLQRRLERLIEDAQPTNEAEHPALAQNPKSQSK